LLNANNSIRHRILVFQSYLVLLLSELCLLLVSNISSLSLTQLTSYTYSKLITNRVHSTITLNMIEKRVSYVLWNYWRLATFLRRQTKKRVHVLWQIGDVLRLSQNFSDFLGSFQLSQLDQSIASFSKRLREQF